MCKSMVDIQSATAEIRRGIKKEDRRKKPQGKNIMSASATQGGHNDDVEYISLKELNRRTRYLRLWRQYASCVNRCWLHYRGQNVAAVDGDRPQSFPGNDVIAAGAFQPRTGLRAADYDAWFGWITCNESSLTPYLGHLSFVYHRLHRDEVRW